MATTYGSELNIDENAMILALLITQFIGVPFAFLFGSLAGRIGAKRAVFAGLAVYAGITMLGYYMKTATQFMALAVLVGMVQGGTQALSRSLFASMIPRHKSSEFFAFFGVFERYAGILGPAVFAWVVQHSGTGRNAILSVILFFVIGAAILTFVDVDAGRRRRGPRSGRTQPADAAARCDARRPAPHPTRRTESLHGRVRRMLARERRLPVDAVCRAATRD